MDQLFFNVSYKGCCPRRVEGWTNSFGLYRLIIYRLISQNLQKCSMTVEKRLVLCSSLSKGAQCSEPELRHAATFNGVRVCQSYRKFSSSAWKLGSSTRVKSRRSSFHLRPSWLRAKFRIGITCWHLCTEGCGLNSVSPLGLSKEWLMTFDVLCNGALFLCGSVYDRWNNIFC